MAVPRSVSESLWHGTARRARIGRLPPYTGALRAEIGRKVEDLAGEESRALRDASAERDMLSQLILKRRFDGGVQGVPEEFASGRVHTVYRAGKPCLNEVREYPETHLFRVPGGPYDGDGPRLHDAGTVDLEAFGRLLPRLARDSGVSLFEARPTDESLESVFAYLVQR